MDIRITTVSAGYVGNGKPSTKKYRTLDAAMADWPLVVSNMPFYAFAALYVDGKCVHHRVSASLQRQGA